MISAAHWPYPRWVAHRGAGKLAPENTLAAFRTGARHGYRMFECDVKLSQDGVPFLLHDESLPRTTNALERLGRQASRLGGDHPWSTLAQLDAGGWHSRAFVGEPLPSLENIARFCRHNDYFLNIEIKATPGLAQETGRVVAQHAARLWQGAQVPALLSSFDPVALEAARNAEPHLPRALLQHTLCRDWLESARALGCVAIVCNYALWDRTSVTQAKDAGFRTLSYTVNDEWAVRRLIDLGTDCIITDRIDLFSAGS